MQFIPIVQGHINRGIGDNKNDGNCPCEILFDLPKMRMTITNQFGSLGICGYIFAYDNVRFGKLDDQLRKKWDTESSDRDPTSILAAFMATFLLHCLPGSKRLALM
jgi:hypothetical protein